MSRSISTQLERRLETLSGEDRRSGLTISLLLHVALLATIWLVSTLEPKAPLFDEFSPVRLVPVAALGSTTAPVEQAPAPQPRQEPVEEPEPEPEPVVEEPEAEPTPSADAIPDPTHTEPAPPAAEERPVPRQQPAPSPQRRGAPGGSRLGTSLAGSDAASFDSDFTYSYYTDQLLAQIDAVWNRPVIGGDIEAVVQFVIRRDGSLGDVRLGRSSGYNSFDLAAMRAIQAAAPFPPLPAAFKGSSLGVNLTVR